MISDTYPTYYSDLQHEVTGQQIIAAIREYAGQQRFKEERIPTGPRKFTTMYGSSGFIVSASGGHELLYHIEPSGTYRAIAVELYDWSARSKVQYPYKSPTQVRAELNRIGGELTRILEGRPQKIPDITFNFQGYLYTVPPEAYTQDRKIYVGASGGLILTVKEWDVSVNPPYPRVIWSDYPTIVMGRELTPQDILDVGGILTRTI